MTTVKGFTLIEVVLTIVIAGILAVAAIPRFANMTTFSSNFYYDEVMSMVRYAQKLAIATGCEIRVGFSGSNLTLKRRASCQTGAFNQEVIDPSSRLSGVSKAAPSGVSISSSDFPIYFDAVGRCHRMAGNIQDSDISIGSRTLRVVGETGFPYEP